MNVLEKDYRERLAAELQFPLRVCGDPARTRRELALSLAVSLAKLRASSGFERTDRVLLVAKRFEEFLDSGATGIPEGEGNEEKQS